MKTLLELLGQELHDQVTAKLGAIKIILDDGSGSMVPKARLDDVIQEKKEALKLVAKHEADLVALQEKAKGNDVLTAQIQDLQRSTAALKLESEQALLKEKKSTAILVALMDAGVMDPAARELLSKNFDPSKIELDENGKPKGFADLVKPIKENQAFAGMFGKTIIKGHEHQSGDNPTPKSELEAQLAAAQKSGNTAQVVAIRRKIQEQETA